MGLSASTETIFVRSKAVLVRYRVEKEVASPLEWLIPAVVLSVATLLRQIGWMGYAVYLRRSGEPEPERKTALLVRAFSVTGFLGGSDGERPRSKDGDKDSPPPGP